MKQINSTKLTNYKRLSSSLRSIQSMSKPESLILSCYLDTRKGKQDCIQAPRAAFDNLADQLTENQRKQLNRSIDRLQQAIESAWHPQARSMAVFCDCLEGQSQTQALALPVPVNEQISVYPKADILPLLNLRGEFDNSTLLVLIDGVIQVYDIDLGAIKPAAWASAPHLKSVPDNRSNQVRHNSRLQQLCLSLLRSLPKPLIITARSADIQSVRSWLPRRINWRLISNIVLPQHVTQSTLMPFIEQEMVLLKQGHSQACTSSLLNSLRFDGPALAGPVLTIEAMLRHRAQQVIIADNHAFQTDLKCSQCGNFSSSFAGSNPCSVCGQHRTRLWNPLIEASWLAYQQQLPITLVDSNDLNYVGGIGCITKQPQRVQRMPLPVLPDRHSIDLVA